MNKKTFLLLCITSYISIYSLNTYASGEAGLVETMAQLQYYTHKTGLSLEAKNRPLAKFYLHELEETIEVLEKIHSYKEHKIGKLTKQILVPAFLTLEEQVEKHDHDAKMKAFDSMINSCNHCHKATQHEFIQIKFNNINPYAQSFKK